MQGIILNQLLRFLKTKSHHLRDLLKTSFLLANIKGFVPDGSSNIIDTQGKTRKTQQKRDFMNRNPIQSLPYSASKDIETHDKMGETYQKRGFMNRYPMETLFYRCDKGNFYQLFFINLLNIFL